MQDLTKRQQEILRMIQSHIERRAPQALDSILAHLFDLEPNVEAHGRRCYAKHHTNEEGNHQREHSE